MEVKLHSYIHYNSQELYILAQYNWNQPVISSRGSEQPVTVCMSALYLSAAWNAASGSRAQEGAIIGTVSAYTSPAAATAAAAAAQVVLHSASAPRMPRTAASASSSTGGHLDYNVSFLTGMLAAGVQLAHMLCCLVM
jgi:hypothetical protein